jgi:phosphatidylserine decarboxylase
MTLFTALQALLPQHLISRAIGVLAFMQHPAWLKTLLIKVFMWSYGISLDEAQVKDPAAFDHFNHFFTRALEADARPLATSRWVSPADGALSQRGNIESGAMIQAKGRWFNVQSLLAGTEEEAATFADGSFATVYLSPRDYHRIHMPIAGQLQWTRYVPGDLFAVNQSTTNGVNNLFARNERLVCYFSTEEGPIVLVLVGAIIVAGIETVWGGVESPAPKTIRDRGWEDGQGPACAAGDEIGRFFLGSTVVMLSDQQDVSWAVESGDPIKVNAPLAY